ncbi:MAG: polysaccharide deacetylase family protein [Clostridia bacterium]|nr:polysaccharide deacetylase family protein [Clostridia bacterium]
MQVIVINKKTWIAVLVCLALIGATVAAYFIFRDKDEGETAPTMAVVDCYELNAIPVNSRLVPVYRVSRTDHAIALTIDAAWSADKTGFILETLDRYNIKATFFLCGVWVKAYPDVVKEIAARGHEIGNHSLTHPHMNRISADEIRKELSDLDDQIEALTGKRCTLFRAPFGEYNDTVVSTVRDMGYEIVQWNLDTVDWKQGRSAETILNAVLPKLSDGSIILSHNNGFEIETYLPKLIEEAQKQGYRFVTISELLPEGNRTIDNNGVCTGA